MKKFFKISLITFLSFLGVILIVFAFFLNNAIKSANTVTFDKDLLISASSKIEMFDNNGNVLKANKANMVVDIEKLPKYVKDAFISIEDKKFYSHKGLNYKRMVASLINNIKSGYVKEGGSTISQQLIKNTHLNSEKTLSRKLKEIVLTKKLEKNFSKDDILETYLNVIYFGNNSYGLENASYNYFGKSSSELSLNEVCCLAGLIKAPTKYSPILNYENSFNRKNLVLSEMKKDGKITKEEYEENITKEITLNLQERQKDIYEQAVILEAENLLNLNEQDLKMIGVKIFTYQDSKLQNELIDIINNDSYYHKNSYGNTADSCAVVIDNETGGVNAFYGKCDYNLITIKRQPGSTIKPILVYSPALEKGIINPDSLILDEKIDYDGYKPNNVGHVFHGYVTTTEAIEQSLNIPAVKIMKKVGIDNCKNFVKKVNLDLANEGNNYALALGGFKYGTNLISLTNTFLPFSQKGNFTASRFIKEIQTDNGKVLWKNQERKTQVMSEESAYLMNKMLIAGVKNGTSKRLNSLPFEVAGKTGTVGIKNTNLNTDAYSVAYTKNKTCGVWLGNTSYKTEYNLEGKNNGGTYASSMLKEIMLKSHENIKIDNFDKAPNGIITIKIDETALENEHQIMLAGENTPPVYVKNIEVNKKFANFKTSPSYSNPKMSNITVKLVDGKPQITFNAQKYLIYKIFRIEEDETKILDTIKNKNGEISFVDETALTDVFYDYYVECYAYNYSTFTPSAKSQSNVVKFIILE